MASKRRMVATIDQVYKWYILEGLTLEEMASKFGIKLPSMYEWVVRWGLDKSHWSLLPRLEQDTLASMPTRQLVLEYYKVLRVEELFASKNPNSKHVLELNSALELIFTTVATKGLSSLSQVEMDNGGYLVGDLNSYELAWLRHKTRCFYSEHAGWSITTDAAVQDSGDAFEYYLRNQ